MRCAPSLCSWGVAVLLSALWPQLSGAAAPGAAQDEESADNEVHMLSAAESAALNIPCPLGWSVLPNPSLDNSLSYLNQSGELAVNVTYIKPQENVPNAPEAFARVAAEQLRCSIPMRSNLIESAWSFTCPDTEVEAVVYGGGSELVLLSISGREPQTEPELEGFVRFLAYQAHRR